MNFYTFFISTSFQIFGVRLIFLFFWKSFILRLSNYDLTVYIYSQIVYEKNIWSISDFWSIKIKQKRQSVFDESAKLHPHVLYVPRALRAAVPHIPRYQHALMPHVSLSLCGSVLYMSRALHTLVPHMPIGLLGFMPHLFCVLYALMTYVLLCVTCSCALHAPRAFCIARFKCQYQLLWFCVNIPFPCT